MGAGVGGGAVKPGGDLEAGCAAIPALEGRTMVPVGDQQLDAAKVDALALWLGDEAQGTAEIGDGGAAVGDRPAGAVELGKPPLDPRAQLAYGRRRLALGGPARQDNLDAVRRIDRDPHPARAFGTPDSVGDRVGAGRGTVPANGPGEDVGDFIHAAQRYRGPPTCRRSRN